MVSIKSSYTVFPSEATPNVSMVLSESEQIQGYHHSRTIYIYRANHNRINNPELHNVINTMKDSLAKILVHYYPLSGRLRIMIGQGGRLELDCPPKGAVLLEAVSTNSLDDYGDFEPSDKIKDLIPKVDYGEPVENLPLLLVQVTRFKCGGICVGIAVSNVIVDGIAGTLFLDTWAKLARGAALESNDMPIFLNREKNLLSSPSSSMGQLVEHREFKPLPLVLGSSDFTVERKKETDLAMMKLTKEMVEKLKKKANDGLIMEFDGTKIIEQPRPYSRYECISAHIWKCAIKARKSDDNQPAVVHIVAGTRNRVNPSLPLNYFGNATYPTVTPTCLSGDIVSKPLSYGAQKIREAIEILTDEYLKSGFEFIRSIDDVRRIRPKFDGEGIVEAPFLGNPNVNIWSWMSNMPMYGPDFGWGRPMYMGPGVVGGDGRAFIMPSAAGDGSLSVVIRLQSDHVEPFKKFFYDDDI